MESHTVTDRADIFLPMLLDEMHHAEAAAWNALALVREPAECMRKLAEWLEVNRELREYQSQVTAMLLEESRRRLRESASVLSTKNPPPLAGQEFMGHGSARWVVQAVTPDALEPHLYLARMHSIGGTADGIHDVYCEDWTLFCLVHGLVRIER